MDIFYLTVDRYHQYKPNIAPGKDNPGGGIMTRYGPKNFFRRIHEQMIGEGNILTCGNQGVDDFSFEQLRR